MTYRNREGQEISPLEWAALWEDMTYRVVAEDTVGSHTVRTVWEGMDDVVGVMFATGVSTDGIKWETVRDDAATKTDARAHHEAVLLEMRNDVNVKGRVE